MTAKTVTDAMFVLADHEKAKFLQRFFKTGKEEYAHGDIFWGIKVPETRVIAKVNKNMPLFEIEKILKSPIHEVRLCGLFILIEQFKKGNETDKKIIVDYYLTNTQYINNWDLVDLSCYKIVGNYLLDKPRDILYSLAKSQNIWEQRIAIVSTWAFIRQNDFKDTLSISELLVDNPHTLIQKAVGWMLREVSKRNEFEMLQFIEKHYFNISRTTLRYAIEKLPEYQRKNILQGNFQ